MSALRPLTGADAPWVADVMVERRARYEHLSPVFWRPAANARTAHETYLAGCIANERFSGLRTNDGFILAELQAAATPPWWSPVRCGFVDDFAVVHDDLWLTDGRDLLLSAWGQMRERGAEAVRVVTARRDPTKVALLESLGLTVGESWWTRASDATPAAEPTFGPVATGGIEALVIPAPPVFDPGGAVCLVTSLAQPQLVERVPQFAIDNGAVLAIVSTKPDSGDLSLLAERAGFDETTRYYVGEVGQS